ncbi:MAG: hypothetical protein QOI78_7280 [Actinomycetota bacterium]|nr:hypothetical protein [Actinomycetota bacterium]
MARPASTTRAPSRNASTIGSCPIAPARGWKLLFAQKAALVVTTVALGDVPEAREAGFVDFGLVVILVVSPCSAAAGRAGRTKAAVA